MIIHTTSKHKQKQRQPKHHTQQINKQTQHKEKQLKTHNNT